MRWACDRATADGSGPRHRNGTSAARVLLKVGAPPPPGRPYPIVSARMLRFSCTPRPTARRTTGQVGRLAVLLLAPALACAASQHAAPDRAGAGRVTPASPDSARAAANVATFEAAWRLVNERHFDSTFNGVDWPAVRAELRGRAAAAGDDDALRDVIRTMLRRLRQSHFAIIPREAADGMESATQHAERTATGERRGPGDVGLSLRMLGDDFVVWRVEAGGAADGAGIRTGWVVRRVGDAALDDVRRRIPAEMGERQARMRATTIAGALLGGPAGTRVRVELVDGRGRNVVRTLARTPERGDPVKFGNLPPFYTSFERERVAAPGGLSVGVLRFNVWMSSITRPFDDAVDAFRDADGIVIDLRGNPGGVGALVMGTAGHFLTTADTLGTMRTRRADLRFVANPRTVSRAGQRVRPYGGPVVVLVDALSASTSEVFAAGLQGVGRARVVGDTSAGMALPALMERLPNGDVLYHAFADFFTPRGERLEGRGVIPDEVVPLTRAALLAGRDPQLDAALRWIAGANAGAQTGKK